MKSILIVRAPQKSELEAKQAWPTFLSDAENAMKLYGNVERPNEACFVIPLETNSAILGALIVAAASSRFGYQLITVPDEQIITWSYKA